MATEHERSAQIVYDHSAELYADSVGTEIDRRFETSFDCAMLDELIASVKGQLSRPSSPDLVLDAGCGTGRVAARLARELPHVCGIDLSAEMIRRARAAHPGVDFEQGALRMLPLADNTLAAAVYWYSIIATPLAALPDVWRELRRVLDESGVALIAFQMGRGEAIDKHDAYGSGTTLTLFRHDIDAVAASLRTSDFEVVAQAHRAAELEHETTPQAFLFVRPAAS